MPDAETEHTVDADENMWQRMLAEASRKNATVAGTDDTPPQVILLGDGKNGKTSLLSKFDGKVMAENNSSAGIMDYCFVNVKNKYNVDKDEVVARMGVWQLDDAHHTGLLSNCIKKENMEKLVYVISLDLSRPWDIMEQLEKWIQAAEDINESLMANLSEEEVAALKHKISKYTQYYEDYKPPVAATAEEVQVEGETGAEENTEEQGETADNTAAAETPAVEEEGGIIETVQDLPVDPAIPAKNLGVPIIIVGNKADYFTRVLAPTGADKKFEFVCQRLRKIALAYGAGLVFTSATGDGINIDLVQDYIYHRVLSLPFEYLAKPAGNKDDFGIAIPAGFDSDALISVGGKGEWGDDTAFEDVFEMPAAVAAQKKGGSKQQKVVYALDDEDFFQRIAESIETGKPMDTEVPDWDADRGRGRSTTLRGDGGRASVTADGVPKKKKIRVKKFFRNLLGGRPSSSSIAEAPQGGD